MSGRIYQASGMWGMADEVMTADEVRKWCRRHNRYFSLAPTRPDQFRVHRVDGLHLNDHELLLFSSLTRQSAGEVFPAAPAGRAARE